MNQYKKRIINERQKTWLNEHIANAQTKEWYGTFTVVFEKGILVRVRKDESLIPPKPR